MILLTTFVCAVVGFLGFLLLAGYIEMVEWWMVTSVPAFLVSIAGGIALVCLYAGLVVQVFDWAGWMGV